MALARNRCFFLSSVTWKKRCWTKWPKRGPAIPEFHSFFRLNNIILHVYTTLCLFIHLLGGIWIVSILRLLWIMLLWTWAHKYLFGFLLSILSGIYLKEELLDCMIILLNFLRILPPLSDNNFMAEIRQIDTKTAVAIKRTRHLVTCPWSQNWLESRVGTWTWVLLLKFIQPSLPYAVSIIGLHQPKVPNLGSQINVSFPPEPLVEDHSFLQAATLCLQSLLAFAVGTWIGYHSS